MKQASLPYQFALPQFFEKLFKPQAPGHIGEVEEEFEEVKAENSSPSSTQTAVTRKIAPSFRVGWTSPKNSPVASANSVAGAKSKKLARALTPDRVVGLHALEHFDQKKTELRWHCTPEADLYEVQYNDTSYDDLRWTLLCETPSIQVVPSDEIPKGNYYFRVRAKSKFGVGPWSGQCRLRVG
jgi:hypothetical protein